MTGFQVGPETFVVLAYTAFDAEGDAVGPTELIAFVFGMGQLLPAVESALEGRTEGEKVEAKLGPEQAFGRRQPQAILTLAREEFPEDASPGDRFEVENPEGDVLIAQLLEVGPDTVTVDMNHPLADQEVTIRAEIREVRPATATEIEAAEAALEEDQAHWQAEIPHVSISGLLRPQDRS